jgi:hypothetical protein
MRSVPVSALKVRRRVSQDRCGIGRYGRTIGAARASFAKLSRPIDDRIR